MRGKEAKRLLVLAALVAAIFGAVPQAGAAPRPVSAVSLGDSYISGEAGRWQGNSVDPVGSRDGTDRAYVNGAYDESRVYVPPSDTNGCHRSDVAEIHSAQIAKVERKINLACSGAQTRNIFRTTSGGVGQNGELPQADQLAAVARSTKVSLIVLSIGGNDLGFSSIVTACVQAYETASTPCNESQQSVIDSRFATAMANVGKAIDEIRAVMAGAGYARADYRLVLQSYPSAIARASELRVSELDRNSRTNVDGCPFYDADATWARDRVVNQIADGLDGVAAAKGAQFMDLRNFLQSREMCSVSTELATPLRPPSAKTSDWARFLNPSAVVSQGKLEETFHPNAYAQRALGTCLKLVAARTGDFRCEETLPGGDTRDLMLNPAD